MWFNVYIYRKVAFLTDLLLADRQSLQKSTGVINHASDAGSVRQRAQ